MLAKHFPVDGPPVVAAQARLAPPLHFKEGAKGSMGGVPAWSDAHAVMPMRAAVPPLRFIASRNRPAFVTQGV